ncbi:MAG: Na+/H+ antiporter NhaC family protein, partial [Balneolaceae bacterium]
MKKLGATGLILILIGILSGGFYHVFAWAGGESANAEVYGTWVSLLPPLVAIGFALVMREVILSLFSGIWIGALFLTDFNPLTATGRSIDFLIDALLVPDHAAIIVFSLLLGGMVGLVTRGGGANGMVDLLEKFATNRTRGQLMTWLAAFFLFFDDYANTLIQGNAFRPITDRLQISREKLAYIVDSTAAPLAVCAVITTWIGFEITQIQNALSGLAAQATDPGQAAQLQAGAENAFLIFLHSLPYLFYPLLAISFVLMIILMKKDFGPMLEAERRAVTGGGILRPGSNPATDTSLESLQPKPGKPRRWVNMALPIIAVIGVALSGLYMTGISALEAGKEQTLTAIIGGADPFAALLWASFAGCAVAIALVIFQKILTVSEALESMVGGMQSMLMAIIILVLAWGLGGVTEEVGTGSFLASRLSESLPLGLLPGLIFFIAAVTAFSTGTSWGTMAILFPVVVPLVVAMGAGVGFAGGEHYVILLGSVSSVMAGAVFGDHCSPISDTTVLSSMSSACDLIDHVRTQLPYALVVAVVALLVGELPAAMEWIHPLWSILLGLVILYAILHFYGKNP